MNAVAPQSAEDVAGNGLVVVGEGDACDLGVQLAFDAVAPASVPSEWRAHTDGYAVEVRRDARGLVAQVFARSGLGARYALRMLLGSLGAIPAEAADWPAFEHRGVIEGFYNAYFTREQRSTTLRLMARLRQDTYLYAPKGDPYAGMRWIDPYDTEGSDSIREAAAIAVQSGVDFVWGISPTLSNNGAHPESSYRFTSADDFAHLVDKLRSVRALGVTRFAILFDDVGGQLYHPEDRSVFASASLAHADLANKIVAAMGGPLLFVGTTYTSSTPDWQSYVGDLGRLLDARIDVMWTGPATFSSHIAPSDLTTVNALLGRMVWLWDNWPTAAGAVSGRDPSLATAATAILTNATLVGDFGHPVDDFWKVLGPVADYAWAPIDYDADAAYDSWQAQLPTIQPCAASGP